jgi:uncharacterized membrane protein (UPF0127 family)
MKTNMRPDGTAKSFRARARPANPAAGRRLWAARCGQVAAWLVAGLLVCTGPAGCDQEKKAPVANKSADDRFPIKVGDRLVQLQVAVLAPELERGLMYRQTMGADEGMVFVFTAAQPQSFWMRNTTLPLDIGYFDSTGELIEIYQMYPLDERPVASHSKSIQFCVEMNQGWFRQAGIKPGARLDVKALADALSARGFKPEIVGLH